MLINPKNNLQAGFVAITSAIVISVLLIIISATLSYSGFFARFNLLETEYKKESLAKAESCVDIARVFIANTPGYTTTNYIPPDVDCSIVSVTGTAPYVIVSSADYKDSQTYIQAEATRTSTDVTIDSWQEYPQDPTL